jgi:hypothetical protein
LTISRWAAAFLAVFMLVLAAGQTMTLTVAQLKQVIESSIKLRHSDKQIAEFLRSVTLSDKLDDQTIDDIQSAGAGVKTVEVLKRLGVESASLKEAPPPPPPPKALPQKPPPDSIKQKAIIDAAREYALDYEKKLPNFICVQVTRRYWDRSGTENWSKLDTITQKLSYYDHQEKYETVSISNHPDDEPIDKLGGLTSRGEFGSLMRAIFDPESHAEFEWDRWRKLRGKEQYSFAYRIEQQYSRYTMSYGERSASEQTVTPGYHGLIYIEADSGLISRFTVVPDIPASFPVRSAKTTLDFDYVKIGDNVYLLPLASRLISKDDRGLMTRNDLDFHLYRKFGTESIIKFAPDAIPEDQLKDEPDEGTPPPKKP